MSDIVERLENMWMEQEPKLLWTDMEAITEEAADEITRLRAENEKLREALRPLAKAYEEFMRVNDCTEYEIANDPYLHTAAAAIRESGDD